LPLAPLPLFRCQKERNMSNMRVDSSDSAAAAAAVGAEEPADQQAAAAGDSNPPQADGVDPAVMEELIGSMLISSMLNMQSLLNSKVEVKRTDGGGWG
jgi:hypothetical protein